MATLSEARSRVFDFFKDACRLVLAIMQIYDLYDVVSPSLLRSAVVAQIGFELGIEYEVLFCFCSLYSKGHFCSNLEEECEKQETPRSPEAQVGMQVEDLWGGQEAELTPSEKLNACFESIPVSDFPPSASEQA